MKNSWGFSVYQDGGVFHTNQASNDNSVPPDFLELPNLLPKSNGSNSSAYRQHRRSRSGIETRIQPDLTFDIDVSEYFLCWSQLPLVTGHTGLHDNAVSADACR